MITVSLPSRASNWLLGIASILLPLMLLYVPTYGQQKSTATESTATELTATELIAQWTEDLPPETGSEIEYLLNAYPKLTAGNQEIARQALQRTTERKLAWDIYQSDANEQLYQALPMTPDHAFTEGIEGPASDSQGNVYAVNLLNNQTIGKVNRWGTSSVWATLPNRGIGNGIVFDSQGDLIVADYVEHKIWRFDRVTATASLVVHEPKMSQPNDLAITDNGTLFASDPDWSKGTGKIWRVDRQGVASVVADGMGTTNGIDISPDGNYLSVNESLQRKIWRFTIQQDGTLAEKTLLKEFPDHGFDGMRYDRQGNLYVTRYGKGTVVVLNPEGEVLREIDVLGARPSNLCFGGTDGKTVCVTEVEHGRLIRFRVEHPGRTPRYNPEVELQDWLSKTLSWPRNHIKVGDNLKAAAPFSTLDQFENARIQIRSRFDKLLGPMPAVGTPPISKTISEEHIDGVIRRRLRIEIEPQVYLDAYVLIPEGINNFEKRPGIVALHPTNNRTIDEIAGVGGNGPRATGLEFAKLGYIVICPQCYLWQDVKSFDEAVNNHRSRHPTTRGIAKMIYDAQRALDLLLAIPQVDADRVFAFGHSLGAKEVLYLMAKDSRIAAGIASEGGVDLESTNWDAPWYLGPKPRIDGTDWGHDELLQLIAPRPVLIMGGEQGPGAADGSQSLQVMHNALPSWEIHNRNRKTTAATNKQRSLGLGIWNHGQGHVFSELQFERARQWLKLMESKDSP